MVNSIGLQNPGVDGFLQNLDAFDLGIPLFVSVAGDTVAEFASLCERLADDDRISAVELNLSCPNVECGGLMFCAGPASVEEVVSACRAAVPGKPILAKLTNEGVVENARAAEAAGADGLTVINTMPALTIDARARKVLVRGGLSGPAIKPVALRAVYDVSGAVDVPVVGSGGVVSGTDVAEFMLAGATAVQIGTTSFVRDPHEILDEFAAYLKENGLGAARADGSRAERSAMTGGQITWQGGQTEAGRLAGRWTYAPDAEYRVDVEAGTRTDGRRTQERARGGQPGTLRAGPPPSGTSRAGGLASTTCSWTLPRSSGAPRSRRCCSP